MGQGVVRNLVNDAAWHLAKDMSHKELCVVNRVLCTLLVDGVVFLHAHDPLEDEGGKAAHDADEDGQSGRHRQDARDGGTTAGAEALHVGGVRDAPEVAGALGVADDRQAAVRGRRQLYLLAGVPQAAAPRVGRAARALTAPAEHPSDVQQDALEQGRQRPHRDDEEQRPHEGLQDGPQQRHEVDRAGEGHAHEPQEAHASAELVVARNILCVALHDSSFVGN
mmetsp:Transcript_46334/g.93471  ORF Transcript_46334/g.93471 Transcript_46334/m.93471 type:complete len:223 (+) Transcript_46334:716-1384(+)